MKKTWQERFWAKVDKNGGIPFSTPDLGECWLWTASCFIDGHGQFWVEGDLLRANRIAYELELGPIPKGHVLKHLCDVTPCVRPSHALPVNKVVNFLKGEEPTELRSKSNLRSLKK